MSKKNAGWLIGVIGVAAVLWALIKFGAIGYYPEEILPFGALLIGGALLFWVGNRMVSKANLEQ